MRSSKNETERITELLGRWRCGDERAEHSLLDLIYPHLKAMAANRLRNEQSDGALETTDLVQEVFVKLLGQRQANWKDRTHFFAIAARLMRRIVVDHARQRHRIKRGANFIKVAFDAVPEIAAEASPDLVSLHESMTALGAIDPLAERVVELRFFGGLTEEEAGEVLGISRATIGRKWRFARAWLEQELSKDSL
ncbi:MAG: sigma-70 family RNA polymerase sigma factor [Deltaproteobacteria bacterium]|nr:sigma-70 family RNA polymerase sigma factor [Deltaproteobacteria bacterium]